MALSGEMDWDHTGTGRSTRHRARGIGTDAEVA